MNLKYIQYIVLITIYVQNIITVMSFECIYVVTGNDDMATHV